MKRALAMLICVMLLLTAIPGSVFAEDLGLSRQAAVIQEVRRIYTKCLETAQLESFAGYCGLMTSHQLWHLGINRDLGGTYNGNQQFDAYANSGSTSGGYHITAYPAQEYTLDQALAAITRNGTRDADNILVGFESTNTEAGSVYGHALVIHTIMDGVVYYVENYYTSLAGEEGNVIACSIDQFVKFYEDWTVLDGVIHFGDRRYSDSCQSFATDLFVRTRFGSTLRSEPCLVGENECERLRTIATGEMLHATAVYMNTRGELYYRIDEGRYSGYVAANAVSISRLNGEAMALKNAELPAALTPGQKIEIAGTVVAENSGISNMAAVITDGSGQVVREARMDTVGCTCDLDKLNAQLEALEEGSYTLEIYATAACVSVKGTGLVTLYSEQKLLRQDLTVGEGVQQRRTAEPEIRQERDGWFIEDGIWHYYKYGKPCTGWVTYLGVDYYLNKDGSVTTGWAEIDGWNRYFTATGAMCTGWLTADDGVHYWLPDGTEAEGLQEIKGKLYYFTEECVLATEGTVTVDDVTYTIQKDGTVIVKE